jgi:hypothetical protein
MKAINSQQYSLAQELIGYSGGRPKEILDAYVEGKWLVLQLQTCRFRILN